MLEDVFSQLKEGIKMVFKFPKWRGKEAIKKWTRRDIWTELFKINFELEAIQWVCISTSFSRWPRGPMDKASDYESGDSRFESWRGRSFLDEEPSIFEQKQPKQMKFVALRLFRKLCRNRFISWKKYEIVGELRSVGKRWRLYILLHSPGA